MTSWGSASLLLPDRNYLEFSVFYFLIVFEPILWASNVDIMDQLDSIYLNKTNFKILD